MVRRECGSILTKLNKLVKPTPEFSFVNSLKMVSLWRENKKFILEPEPDCTFNPREEEITLELVRGEVPDRAECPPRSCGSDDREFSGDYSGSTERPRKLIVLSIINSILPPRETSSRIEQFSLKPFSKKKVKKFKPKNLKPNRTPDVKRINK